MNDLYVGVPFSGCEKYIGDNAIIATREDEAIAIAVGAWFCGKKPLVFMQNSGLGNSLDIITSLLKPYNIDVDFIVSNRKTPEHHWYMWSITEVLFKALHYDKVEYC